MTLAGDITSTYFILKVHNMYEHTTKTCVVTSLHKLAFCYLQDKNVPFYLLLTNPQERTKLKLQHVKHYKTE